MNTNGFLDDNDPASKLGEAARAGNIEILKANVNLLMTIDWHGDCILSHAIHQNSKKSYESMEFIASTPHFKTMLHIPSQMGHYPLYHAAYGDNPHFLEFILEKGGRVLQPGSVKGTPLSLLHMLVGDNKIHTLKLILEDLEDQTKYTNEEVISLFAYKTYMDGIPEIGDEFLTPIELAKHMSDRETAYSMLKTFHNHHLPGLYI